MNRRLFLSSVAVLPLAKPSFLSNKTFLESLGLTTAYSFIGDGVSSPYRIVYKLTNSEGCSLRRVHKSLMIDYKKPGIIYPIGGKIFVLDGLNNYQRYTSKNNTRIFECITKTAKPGERLFAPYNLDINNIHLIWKSSFHHMYYYGKDGHPSDLAKTLYCDSLEVRRELKYENILLYS